MKFFTPELYLRFNSVNDEQANQADDAWEQALRSYESHLKKLAEDMPPRVKTLAEKCCLHDAELLSFQQEESEPLALRFQLFFPFLPIAIAMLREQQDLIILVYLLWNKVREGKPHEGWPFSSLKRHWLYDEIDVDNRGPGLFWHRVLLSDGTIIEIPFFDVFIQTLAFSTFEAGIGMLRGR